MMPMEDECIAVLRNKLEACLQRNQYLDKENRRLKQELAVMNGQVASLRAQFQGKKLASPQKKFQPSIVSNITSGDKQATLKDFSVEAVNNNTSLSKGFFSNNILAKQRAPRIPKPPPRPTTNLPEAVPSSNGDKVSPPPPPPPPPPPRKLMQSSKSNMVRRAPEVVELYQTLTKRDTRFSKTTLSGAMAVVNTREMIGEIENRSSYLLAIKSDVETQGEFINMLAKEVENAAYGDINYVEAFVKWLDEELSYLVDERAVLRHFLCWPEKKADAMREAAFGYRDLRNLESEVSSFRDDLCQPTTCALKQIQILQDKIERSVHALERVRDSTGRRYKDFQIPCEWMLDNGMIAKLKAGSTKLVKCYLKRILLELQSQVNLEEDDLIVHGVRFTFRVHQFVGGLDAESRLAFQDLKKAASICQQEAREW